MRPYGQTRNPVVGAVINRPEVSSRTINNGRMICAPTIEESYFWGDFDENRAFLEQFVHEIVGLSNILYSERFKESSKFFFRGEPAERAHR